MVLWLTNNFLVFFCSHPVVVFSFNCWPGYYAAVHVPVDVTKVASIWTVSKKRASQTCPRISHHYSSYRILQPVANAIARLSPERIEESTVRYRTITARRRRWECELFAERNFFVVNYIYFHILYSVYFPHDSYDTFVDLQLPNRILEYIYQGHRVRSGSKKPNNVGSAAFGQRQSCVAMFLL